MLLDVVRSLQEQAFQKEKYPQQKKTILQQSTGPCRDEKCSPAAVDLKKKGVIEYDRATIALTDMAFPGGNGPSVE